jgi:hypothetical protein
MQSISLTSQQKAPFQFADNKTTSSDTAQAKRILQNISQHIAEYMHLGLRPNSVSFISKKRRNSRIIVYNLDALLTEKNLFVVIFYANKRQDLTEAFDKQFFKTDWEIAMSLMGNNNLLCYASQELVDGNWFNLVLFTKPSEKETVLASQTHNYAAYTLAPKRFTWIRLHNAYLPTGIMQYQDITIQKTKYYNFDQYWFAERVY